MEKEKIAELFMKGIDCSQVVAGAFAEELGHAGEREINSLVFLYSQCSQTISHSPRFRFAASKDTPTFTSRLPSTV